VAEKEEMGVSMVKAIIDTLQNNKDYLSRIDGEIGDGDHGVNLNKGVTFAAEQLAQQETDMSGALAVLGRTLMTRIGGSLGPLYGTFFMEMARASKGVAALDVNTVGKMLHDAAEGMGRISSAKQGDKTMMDTLLPAVAAFETAATNGADLRKALLQMKQAAQTGMESTREMVAKIGRSSRLGERSKGVLDAGAISMNLILQCFADQVLTMENK
jgi:dihydroxyacetone kinase-like protein